MFRRFFRLLLLFAVFHHGAALPGSWQAGVADGEAAQHAVMHWLVQDHHHHDDGGVHEHGGDEAAQHLQIDNVVQSPALMAALDAPEGVEARPAAPAPRAQARPKAIFLALPERPPRARA